MAVIGMTAQGNAGMEIDAQLIVGEPMDAYIARERRFAEGPPLLGIIPGGLGALFLLLGGVFLWTSRRSAGGYVK